MSEPTAKEATIATNNNIANSMETKKRIELILKASPLPKAIQTANGEIPVKRSTNNPKIASNTRVSESFLSKGGELTRSFDNGVSCLSNVKFFASFLILSIGVSTSTVLELFD